MKKIACLAVTLLLVAVAAPAFAADSGSWKGWIADEPCAANYQKSASAGHAGCATTCVKQKGAKWALSTPDGSYVLSLGDLNAEEFLGREVTVTGDYNQGSNTITVSKVQ